MFCTSTTRRRRQRELTAGAAFASLALLALPAATQAQCPTEYAHAEFAWATFHSQGIQIYVDATLDRALECGYYYDDFGNQVGNMYRGYLECRTEQGVMVGTAESGLIQACEQGTHTFQVQDDNNNTYFPEGTYLMKVKLECESYETVYWGHNVTFNLYFG